MCRHFPAGSQILQLQGALPEGLAAAAARKPDGTYTVALVNFGDSAQEVSLRLPGECEGYDLQLYNDHLEKQTVPATNRPTVLLPAQTFAIFAKE